jgi:hypothetical protein
MNVTKIMKVLRLRGPEYRVFIWHLYSGAMTTEGSLIEGPPDRRTEILERRGLVTVKRSRRHSRVRFTDAGRRAVIKFRLMAGPDG